MPKYLGQTPIEISKSEYKDFQPSDWAMLWIEVYGGIDGSHHKTWVIDQVARILMGTEIIAVNAKWDDGQSEDRFWLNEPSQEYLDWVVGMKNGEDGPDTYDYDEGIAP